MMSKKRPLRSALVALVAMTTASAHAQAPGDQADALFQRGRELLSAGRVADACSAFDESQRLDPTPATVLNQANCRERNGQLATAWQLYLEAARQTGAATDKGSRQMNTTSTDRAARLAKRVSTLRIVVVGPAARVDGLEVLRDGELLDPASWNQAVAIDGGVHSVSARAPGRLPWSATIVVATERETKAIEVPELQLPTHAAPVGAPPPATAAAVAPASAPRTTGWTARRKVALGVAAGGALALGAASVLGVSALQRQHFVHTLCPDPALACEDADRATALSRSAHHRATAANIGYGIAAGAAAAAVVLWVTGRPGVQREVALVPAVSSEQFVVSAIRSW